MKPIANVGDIVTVEGFGPRLFEVVSFSHEFMVDSEHVYEEIYYDLQCVITAEYVLADQYDIKVVDKSGGIEIEYMSSNKKSEDEFEENDPSTDGLLDEINDYKILINMFGDETGEYKANIERIKIRLKNKFKGGDK